MARKKRNLFLIALALSCMLTVVALWATSLAASPSVEVAVSFSDRALRHLAYDKHPVCLSLVITGPGVKGEEFGPILDLLKGAEHCVQGPESVKFTPEFYSRWSLKRINGPPRIDIQGSSWNRDTFKNDYDCSLIYMPFDAVPQHVLPMRCDLLEDVKS